MKKSNLLVTLFFLFITLNAWSQVDKGIELFLLGDYEEAKSAFEQSISQNPDISYYYLGEIALRKNNAEEAANYYGKGIETGGEALFCQIGKMKLDLKSTPEELKKNLKAITKKNRKNASLLLVVAQAYFDNNLFEDMENALSTARKADKKYPYIYIFEGDMLKEKGDAGGAAMQYEQAINFDPKNTIAYVKNSLVYESTSSTVAINTLKTGLEVNPESAIIRKYLARSYYKNGFYEQSIAEYEILKQAGTLQFEDERNYAASLYFAGKYNEALASLNSIISKEPNNPVINRLLMYTHDKLKNYDEAVVIGRKFFSLPSGNDNINYLVTDYTVLADALMAKGEIDEAIKAYEKAVLIEPVQAILSKEIAQKLNNADRTADAAVFYQKYIAATPDAEASDYLQVGLYFYRTAGKFSSKITAAEKDQPESQPATVQLKDSMAQYIAKADEAFGKVIELAPESYQGYYWRATANTLLDPDLSKGLANDDYLKMIEVMIAGEDNSNQNRLIEAYRYFSIYYLYQFDANNQADNKNKAKEYADKVLQLKPDDDTSLKILEVLSN